MKKRLYLALLVTLTTAFVLTGCNGCNTETVEETIETVSEEVLSETEVSETETTEEVTEPATEDTTETTSEVEETTETVFEPYEAVVDVVGPEYAVDEDGHIVGEVDGVWYEYLNMQDYMSELWTEELLIDGKYRYEVSLGLNHEYNSDTLYVELYYNSDDIFDNSFMENIYVTCIEHGAVNYGRHIRPYMQYPGYLYFEIENFEDAYLSYVFHGVSDCRITSFTPESFGADEWEDYLGIYPEDMVGDEHGVPAEIEEESVDMIESVED